MGEAENFSFLCFVCLKRAIEMVVFPVGGKLVCPGCAAEVTEKYLKYIPPCAPTDKRVRT